MSEELASSNFLVSCTRTRHHHSHCSISVLLSTSLTAYVIIPMASAVATKAQYGTPFCSSVVCMLKIEHANVSGMKAKAGSVGFATVRASAMLRLLSKSAISDLESKKAACVSSMKARRSCPRVGSSISRSLKIYRQAPLLKAVVTLYSAALLPRYT